MESLCKGTIEGITSASTPGECLQQAWVRFETGAIPVQLNPVMFRASVFWYQKKVPFSYVWTSGPAFFTDDKQYSSKFSSKIKQTGHGIEQTKKCQYRNRRFLSHYRLTIFKQFFHSTIVWSTSLQTKIDASGWSKIEERVRKPFGKRWHYIDSKWQAFLYNLQWF